MDQQSYRLAVELRGRLHDQLRQNETYRAFQHVEALIAMFDGNEAAGAPPLALSRPESVAPAGKRKRRAAVRHHAGSMAARIAAGARIHLEAKGARAQTSEIYKALIAQGIEVSGKDPLKTTASYLSHSKHFNNVPGQGYGLKEWPTDANPAKAESQPHNDVPNGSPLLGGTALQSRWMPNGKEHTPMT